MDSRRDSASDGNSADGGIQFRDDEDDDVSFGRHMLDESSRHDSEAEMNFRDTGALPMHHPIDSDVDDSRYDDTGGKFDSFRDDLVDRELNVQMEDDPAERDLNNTTINSTQNNVDTAEFDKFRDEFIERELEQMEEEEEKVDSEEDVPEHKEGERAPVTKAKPSPATPQIITQPKAQAEPDAGTKGKQAEPVTKPISAGIAAAQPTKAAVDVKTPSTTEVPNTTSTIIAGEPTAGGITQIAKAEQSTKKEPKAELKTPAPEQQTGGPPSQPSGTAPGKPVETEAAGTYPTSARAAKASLVVDDTAAKDAPQPDSGSSKKPWQKPARKPSSEKVIVAKTGDKATEKTTDKPSDKPAGKPMEEPAEQPVVNPAVKPAEKPVEVQSAPSAAAPVKASPRANATPRSERGASSEPAATPAAAAGAAESTADKGAAKASNKAPAQVSSVTDEEREQVKRDLEALHQTTGIDATAAPAASAATAAPAGALSARGNKDQVAAPVTQPTTATSAAPAPGAIKTGAPTGADAKQERPASDKPVSRFKKNREAAESAGNKGGELIPAVMPQSELALKLQSTWRGKQERRTLKVKQISAATIQRVFRGLYVRHRSSAQLNSHREKIAAEQTRKTRLAHIRSKEKDLALLSTIPAEQYMGYERLRRENGAKAIQRNWRAVQMQRQYARMAASEAELDEWLGDDMLLGSKAAACFDTRRFPYNYPSKPGKPSGTNTRIPGGASSSFLTSKVASEEQVLREQSDKLKAHMVNVIQEAISEHKRDELFAKYKAQSEVPRTQATPGTGAAGFTGAATPATPGLPDAAAWKKYEIEIEALSLAQLQRRIRESAHIRTRKHDLRANKSGFRAAGSAFGDRATDISSSFDATNRKTEGTGNGTGGAPRWGARRNYQDLMEAQMHANILLQEHQYALPHIMQRQEARHKVLGNCQHLLQQLQKPLSLDQAKAFITAKQQAAAQAGASLKPGDKKGADTTSTSAPLDPHAEAWLVDEELWNTGQASNVAPAGAAPVRPGQALYVEPRAIQAATEQHVQALYALRTSSITHDNAKQPAERAPGRAKHWGAVALPLPLHVVTNPAPAAAEAPGNSLRGSGEWKGLRGSFNRSFDADNSAPADKNAARAVAGQAPGSLSQRLLTDAKLFRPLASQWAKGSDVEDSLYWIAYATQPSNIVPGSITPSPLQPAEPANTSKTGAAGTAEPATDAQSAQQTQQAARDCAHLENKARVDQENEDLRRRVAVEAMALGQRVPRVLKQCRHEEERISRLAEVYQAEMFAYLRREHALSAQQLLGGERAQQQYRAAARIQAAARGRSARIYTSGIRAQRRVYLALQNLLNEISYTEGVSAPALPVPSHGHNGYNSGYGQQQGQQGHSRNQQGGRAAMLGTLLSSLPGVGGNLPAPRQYASKGAVGSGHSAASLSRASSSTLAGLNITSSTAANTNANRMGGTQISGLTTTPHHGGGGHSNSVNMSALSATPQTHTGRVGYAEGLAPQYPLQSVAPPTNRQYSAAHTGTKDLVSNVNAIHVNAHNNTPSYFSPMVSGLDNVPPSTRGIGAHQGDYSARSDYSSDMVGIAVATPGASVVNRGAWHSSTPGKRASSYGSDAGAATIATMGISSPSKQTFKLLNANFTAADQVPSESLHLSHSYNSDQAGDLTAPRSPTSRGGAFRRSSAYSQSESKNGGASGAFSPKPGVSFSLELQVPEGGDNTGETPRLGEVHTPGSTASQALSEYSFMHDEDVAPGAAYISSPGHSHSGNSLSRSLSASFGQVSDKIITDDHKTSHREEKSLSPVAQSPVGRKSSRYPDDYGSAKVASARTGSTVGGGALNPAMLAQYGGSNKSQNPLDESSDDSVDGMELSYGGGDAAQGSVKGFRIHSTAQAAQRAERAAVAVGQAMTAVEQRFRSGTCSVGGFIASALAADVRNFDKSAALRLLQSMAMVTGVAPLVKWLQRFRYDPQQAHVNDPDYVPPAAGKPSPNTSLVLGVGEIQVQDCALLIAELSAELHIMDTSSGPTGPQKGARSEEEREKEMLFNLIQSCVLMKLLGAANDSGRLRISEIHALLEDAWVRAVPNNGTRVSLMLAQLRFSLLQQATRKAGHPRKLFDDIVTASKVVVAARTNKSSSALEQWAEEDCVSSASVGVIFEHIFATSASFSAYSANKALCAELAQALVRFNAWSDHEDYIPVADLRNSVCNLCSFRILQKRLQVWFRAVPNMHPTLLKHIGAQLNADAQLNGMVSTAAFCRCADLSSVPLSQAECFMLAQLLTRRRTTPAGGAGAGGAGADASNVYVDVALLQRIKTGDFLHAALV